MSEQPKSTDGALKREDEPEKTDVGALHAPIMREKLEPRDGYEPVPLWLVAAFGALLFWGGWYLATYNGGFRADVLSEEPRARFEVPGMADTARPTPGPMVTGKRLFTANCAVCHQAGGQGIPNAYPPLSGSEWVQGEPARLKRILLRGLEGPVRVKGATYTGSMPSFERLNDEQIAAVLTYVRNSWENSAGAISSASVAATRKAIASRTAPWTMSELMTVTQDDFSTSLIPAPATDPSSRDSAPSKP